MSKAGPRLLASLLASDRAFRGIGPARAAALEARFGDGLEDAILRCDEGVIAVAGEEAALNAAAVLETRRAEAAFLAWLDRTGADIPALQAIRLARAWGPQGFEEVARNPWLLLAVTGWRTADAIGRSLGIAGDDPRRRTGAIEAVLAGDDVLGQGSTRRAGSGVLRAASRLAGHDLAEDTLAEAIRNGAAVELGPGLQPPGAAWMEAGCALRFARLAKEPPATGRVPEARMADLAQTARAALPFALTPMQAEALQLAHRHRLAVLAGYAGSGKTTVLRGICATLEADGRVPLIVTLSGRAAQQAHAATGRRAITVARFLLEVEARDAPLPPGCALIADEASMLGLAEVWRILRRLGEASLLLCGDPAQLPPVSPGLVFHVLAADPGTPRIVLDRVHRQDEATGIPALAERVRNGRIPPLPIFGGAAPGVSFAPCRREDLAPCLQEIGAALRAAGTGRDEMQIIAPTNREIAAINGFFHRLRLGRGRPPCWPGSGHAAEDEPVIWTRNDPERGLANGSMGRIRHITARGATVLLDGRDIELGAAEGQFIELAYAVSVHKAQGSQWRRVLVPVFGSRILDRSLVYTALTRAQEQVIFLGDRTALDRAVARAPAAERRDTGFADWLALAREQIRDSAP